jgi:O-acetyl-ADP-ribose deacetylase (regulator of RNase III)
LKLKSIAFPALGTGVAGFPVDDCAESMIGAVRDYTVAQTDSSLELAVFVLFTSAITKSSKELRSSEEAMIFFDIDYAT